MSRDEIISLSKLCGTDGYPSKAGENFIAAMRQMPVEEWDLELTVAFVKAANTTRCCYSFEHLHECLASKAQDGAANYDWNFMMANILYNLQSEECVIYMRQAVVLAGGNPDIDYERTFTVAWEKIVANRGDELTDEELLALYIKENPQT